MDDNIRMQLEVAGMLFDEGIAPLCPLGMFGMQFALNRTDDEWMQLDFAMVKRADCLYRFGGESKGADAECAYAMSLGIPVIKGHFRPTRSDVRRVRRILTRRDK
jgi:hypothetical protein